MPTNSSRFLDKTITPRRRKTPKACDFCRAHRVRCEADTPCPQYRANNVTCNRSTLLKRQSKLIWAQNNDTAARHLVGRSSIDTTPVNDAQSSKSAILTPSQPANLKWTFHKTDSSWGFIARINAFCSQVSQLTPDNTASHFPSTGLQETHVQAVRVCNRNKKKRRGPGLVYKVAFRCFIKCETDLMSRRETINIILAI